MTSVPHEVAKAVAPDEDAKQDRALAIETVRPRSRRTTERTSSASIWTTEHHLEAAAEASTEVHVSLQGPAAPRTVIAADAAAAKVAREIRPAVALALLTADVAARLFCLSVFWVLLITIILVSNAALCMTLIHRKGMSVEAALGITIALDIALGAASLAFVARPLSTDIIQWGAQKLQPGKEKLERLTRKQRDGNPKGGRLKGLQLKDLQRRVQDQAEWTLAKAKQKMRGQVAEAGSPSDAAGACQGGSTAVEEGLADKGKASSEVASAYQNKRVSLTALVMEVQRLTSALVMADEPAGSQID